MSDEMHVIVLEGDSREVCLRTLQLMEERRLELRCVSVERIHPPTRTVTLRLECWLAKEGGAAGTPPDVCLQMLSDAVCNFRR